MSGAKAKEVAFLKIISRTIYLSKLLSGYSAVVCTIIVKVVARDIRLRRPNNWKSFICGYSYTCVLKMETSTDCCQILVATKISWKLFEYTYLCIYINIEMCEQPKYPLYIRNLHNIGCTFLGEKFSVFISRPSATCPVRDSSASETRQEESCQVI